MSSEGSNSLHEVFPKANPAVLDQLSNVDCIVYSIGSLFTSLFPSLVLLGIGEIIYSRSCPKIYFKLIWLLPLFGTSVEWNS
ncbi:hypothetical protein CRYUN_Cryun37aG0097600 [Craigia yunnanensis]